MVPPPVDIDGYVLRPPEQYRDVRVPLRPRVAGVPVVLAKCSTASVLGRTAERAGWPGSAQLIGDYAYLPVCEMGDHLWTVLIATSNPLNDSSGETREAAAVLLGDEEDVVLFDMRLTCTGCGSVARMYGLTDGGVRTIAALDPLPLRSGDFTAQHASGTAQHGDLEYTVHHDEVPGVVGTIKLFGTGPADHAYRARLYTWDRDEEVQAATPAECLRQIADINTKDTNDELNG